MLEAQSQPDETLAILVKERTERFLDHHIVQRPPTHTHTHTHPRPHPFQAASP